MNFMYMLREIYIEPIHFSSNDIFFPQREKLYENQVLGLLLNL